MPHYRTREDYWHAHGWDQLAAEVRRRTVAELQKKGIEPDPESAFYKNTFNRLAAAYKSEVKGEKKAKEKQNAQWLRQHQNDTDEQLLQYLRDAVTDPRQLEKPGRVLGGYFLARRFGGWNNALVKAGLVEPKQQSEIVS